MVTQTQYPQNEAERLNALRRYQILDTPPEPAFDRIAEMAATLFQVPMAVVSLVDEDRVWFKSRLGIDADHCARDAGLCASAIASPGVYYLRDAAHDERAVGHPLVPALGIRFYAAAPLRTHDGLNLGTVCVLDQQPRELAPGQAEMLEMLAALAMNQMELRLYSEKVAELEQARTVIDAIPQLISVLNPEGEFLYSNQAVMDYTGLTRKEVMAVDFRARAAHPEDVERLREKRQQALTRGLPFQIEQRARRKDGQYRWFLVQYEPFRDGRGEVIRWYATGTDIEDRKQAEERTRKENLALEKERTRLESQNAYLLDEIRAEQNFGDIIGGSSGLRKVMHQVQLVAPTDATVLITGESGTGKELIARAIHERGARSERTLVKLNCSAVPEGLFESEFFGHVKGAFTGALKDKPGRFELADGGTLFLDEIGEVPFAMQAKLLRVLQEQELERVGDTRTRKVNVRVIAATNRDLKKEVDDGRFREDLFYRLSVFPIEVPPLRERRDDIGPLVAHFIRQSARRMNRPEPQISKTAFDQLAAWHWPGNVRELQNTVERAIILWREGPLAFDLPASRPHKSSGEEVKPAAKTALLTLDELKRQEREAIINALIQANGKVSGARGAAELLGMKPSTLASRISSMSIDPKALDRKALHGRALD
jgi:PAS domain S-box-containing protein